MPQDGRGHRRRDRGGPALTAPTSLPGGVPDVASAEPLHGGSIADVWRARLTDGGTVVVKRTTYDATLEAEGLRALDQAGAPVPQVLAASTDLLVLEHVSGPADWRGVGAAVARLHRADVGATFGWERDNVVGPLPQDNTPDHDWPSFYVERRVRAHLPHASALPADLRERLDRACDGLLREVLEHDVRPSLVHGDLWSGNVVDGRWLIDPAVHRADRELDLAFADLFGGFPPDFWRAYEHVWPLDPGWERRRPALQLHHLLVHVRLFGASYVPAVRSRLDELEVTGASGS